MFTTLDDGSGSASRPALRPLVRPLTPAGLLGRRALKRFLYSQMALRQGLMIALGREQPYVPFTVEADPPSVYWAFRIADDRIDGLGERLGLPAGLELAPIRCLADDDPEHLLTLNVYRVSGLANGIRAEWSVYVRDAEGRLRYLVVDARSSQTSMDPVDIITPATHVTHEREGLVLRTVVGEGAASFRCELALPAAEDRRAVSPAPDWVTANDRIFWGNGICDRTFYDAGLADPRQVLVPDVDATIDDGTAWADLVEPDPIRILVLRDAIELVISPWENVDRMAR